MLESEAGPAEERDGDYFGTTVNTTARLCGLGSGTDLIVSSVVRADAEVAAFLAAGENALHTMSERVTLKGFGATAFEVWRVSGASP